MLRSLVGSEMCIRDRCGAAPGTLDGIKSDLEADAEINVVRYSSKLLDTFDELGREFILAHGNVEFV